MVAKFLSHHPKVSAVYYPGLSGHPGYAVQQAQARGGGAVLTFTVGSHEAAKQIAENSELFRISVSFGSINSTISIPLRMSHASVPLELRPSRSLPEDLLRISVGIEDPEDLIRDLEARLEVI
jgi:cysteine-S-conjugate beta-lyase